METVCQKDIETLDRLIEISGIAFNSYSKLAHLTLEKHLKPSTDVTNKIKATKDEIKLVEEVEDKLFATFDKNNLEELIDHIGDGLETIEMHDDLEAIVTGENLLAAVRRVINKLSLYALFKEGIDNPHNSQNPYYNPLGDYPTNYVKFKFGRLLEQDTINRFIYYIDQELKNKANIDRFKQLIEAKYNLLYISKASYIENDLFNSKDRLIISVYGFSKLYNIDPKEIQIGYNKPRYNLCVNNLMMHKNEEYIDPKIQLEAILNKCLIKAILTGYTMQEIIYLKSIFEKKSNATLKDIDERRTSYEIVLSSFREAIEDRIKVKEI